MRKMKTIQITTFLQKWNIRKNDSSSGSKRLASCDEKEIIYIDAKLVS